MRIIGVGAMPRDAQPHEVLRAIAQGASMRAQYFDSETGQPISKPFDTYPSWDQRIRCAEAAAPYFAPKLASMQTYTPPDDLGGRTGEEIAADLSDEELLRIIAAGRYEAAAGDAGPRVARKSEKSPRRVDKPSKD
jgi:hypothetical protein